MQTLYMLRSDLAQDGSPDPDTSAWGRVESVVETWTTGRLDLHLASDGVERRSASRGAVGTSTLKTGLDGSRLRTWRVRTIDPSAPAWAYDVTLWLGHDASTAGQRASVTVRLGAHARHGRLVELPRPPVAPSVIRQLLQERWISADGHVLGHARSVDAGGAPALVEHLISGDRSRPVLVLTPAPRTGRPVLDPRETTRRLAGLAHVVLLTDSAATTAFTDAMGGPHLSAFGGSAGLYWPGLDLGRDRSGDHPTWHPDRLAATDPARLQARLFARLGRSSALSLAAPPLEARLDKEADTQRRAAVSARAEALTKSHNDALGELERLRSEAETAVTAADFTEEDWFTEHERVADELEATAARVEELELEIELAQGRLATAEENLHAITMATANSGPAPAQGLDDDDLEDDDPDDGADPTTVHGAVDVARSQCQHLAFLPEALTSARNSGFPRPRQVLDDLLALERVAAAWSKRALGCSIEDALVREGVLGYRSGISKTARNKYAEDYERTYQGQTIELGPHIAHGVGAITTIMRIYWYEDSEAGVFVIGHVGEKLRDDSNP